jgi:hypothetical protein
VIRLVFLFVAACAGEPHEPIAKKVEVVHPGHAHPHLHPHEWGGHHHHPHPHPHLAGPAGHHHPY